MPQVANAASWSGISFEYPTAWESSDLEAVACSTVCFGVGVQHEIFKEPERAMIMQKEKHTFFNVPVSTPRGSDLKAVGCSPESGECFAVGWEVGGVEHASFVERKLEGKEWEFESTPEPTGATSAELTGVSCERNALCVAVGRWKNGASGYSPFAIEYTGTTWSLLSTVKPTEVKEIYPNGVSCKREGGLANGPCEMVGYYENSSGRLLPFAEKWKSGGSWTLQTVPTPTGSIGAVARGVGCTKVVGSLTVECTMVGAYGTETGEKTLAERWNGTEWKIQESKSMKGEEATNDLYGVSCASAKECIAVGEVKNSSQQSNAQIWNGTEWKFQEIEAPQESLPRLQGISCHESTTVFCVDVGYFVVEPKSTPKLRAKANVYE
jgi:hypothetical protein